MIEIWKPLMQAHTGIRKVSIAIHKVMQEGDVVKVQFTYKRKDGTLIHPYPFLISKEKALTFPKTNIVGKNGGTVPCITIPLFEFKEDVSIVPQNNNNIIIYKTEPRNLGDIPTKPCWICKGTIFWQAKWGEWFCEVCHNNPNPSVNTTVVDIKENLIETPSKS